MSRSFPWRDHLSVFADLIQVTTFFGLTWAGLVATLVLVIGWLTEVPSYWLAVGTPVAALAMLVVVNIRALRGRPATAAQHIYLTPYQVVHYLADESEWGTMKELEKSAEGLNYFVLVEAPVEFQKRAAEGKITVYGMSSKTHAHEEINKTFWMSCGFDYSTLF